MLSSRTRSAPAVERLGAPGRACRTSTSTGSPGNVARTASNAARDPAGRDDVVVLDQRRVRQRHPVVDAAAAAHRVLLQRAQPGRRLAGVADRGAGAGDRVDPARGSAVATPDRWQSRFSAVRSAVSRSRVGPVDGQQHVARRDPRRRPATPRVDVGAAPSADDRRTRPRRPAARRRTPAARGDEVGRRHAGRPGRSRPTSRRRRRRGPRPARRATSASTAPGRARRPAARRSAGQAHRPRCRLMRRPSRQRTSAVDAAVARPSASVTRCAAASCASSRLGEVLAPVAPRVSSRPRAAARRARATVCRLVASQALGARVAAAARGRSSRSRAERSRPRLSRAAQHAGAVGHRRLRRCSRVDASSSPHRAGRRGAGSPARRQRRRARSRADPRGEHQALEQRVGRQPVGAVHAGAGALAAGVQAGHAGAAVQVGAHAAAGVVRGRRDRDQLGHRVDAVRAAAREDRREPVLPHLRAEVRGRRARRVGARSRASGA